MSMRVNFPVARRGNVVVSLLRLGVQLRREALHFFVLATGYPAAGVVSCATSFELLPESSGFLAVLIVAQYKDVRASGNTALSSPCWDRSHHAPSG
ncbi:hypothetical protein F511_25724 [Dorcoceras hygrometricum]|uniref:Uncharacterized protein n=1 Tax=Dorcoceras hygrometricum TaxID=472368 RepID=A0A2Z7C192_9LAMI|nr:hypothetical protein F511_25724 [Dorcoceras hygrometricum]